MSRITRIALLMMIAAAGRCGADQRPNILFIMSDDHAAHAISAYRGRLAKIAPTPNIDRLAREGALFSNAFCTNSICSPSRACVLTGQYNHTNGAVDLAGRVEPGQQTLAIEMGRAGYHTAMIGKWHLKAEPAAFDYYCVLPGQGKYHDPEFRVRGDKPWGKNTINKDGKHSTDAITDLTLAWLKERLAHETRNLYDDPSQAVLVERLKARLAEARRRVGDDGSQFPKCEQVVQEFWDYSEADREKARDLSRRYLSRRAEELKSGQRNVRTWTGP